MNFRDDNRAVTVQIGAILLFATLIIALSIYQVTFVPSQNADIEYKHSQEVQSDLGDVRNVVLGAAATGNSQPTAVQLGTQYPSRVFLVNPPPATGSLRTGRYQDDRFWVSNIRASEDETNEFFTAMMDETGHSWEASTKYLEYEPDYNEYDNPPTLVYEASLLSNYYANTGTGDNVTIPLTDQALVNNETKTITLVALNGSLSTSRAGSVTVTPETLSAPHQRVQVEPVDASENITVSIPTRISAAQLANRTTLGETVSLEQPSQNRVTINITWDDEFTLQTARIGVGSDTQNPPPRYLTVIQEGGNSITVEARDRFNNAESGVTVTVNKSTPTALFTRSSRVTNEDGQATFTVNKATGGTATLSILGNDTAYENVQVSAVGTGTGGDIGGDPGTDDQPTIELFELSTVGNSGKINANWEVADSNNNLEEVTVEFESLNSSDLGTYSRDISGGQDSWDYTYPGNKGETYSVTITVVDSDGNQRSITKRQVAGKT